MGSVCFSGRNSPALSLHGAQSTRKLHDPQATVFRAEDVFGAAAGDLEDLLTSVPGRWHHRVCPKVMGVKPRPRLGTCTEGSSNASAPRGEICTHHEETKNVLESVILRVYAKCLLLGKGFFYLLRPASW